MSGLGDRGDNLSIMIPTYNCAHYLRETLLSVKAQGAALDQAQIEVVDDCSTIDDPEAVVRDVWGDKVSFFRQPANVGPTANFNTCLDRATRRWIHILHGDDALLPVAHGELGCCLRAFPDAVAVFGRVVTIDQDGRWTGVTPLLGPAHRGRLAYDPDTWAKNPVQFAGAFLSREALDTVGCFDEHFTHVADWNMWWRIARTGRAAYSNTCVGAYRIFEGNHSSTLRRTARNIQEYVEQIDRVVACAREGSPRRADSRAMYSGVASLAIRQCASYVGEGTAFGANMAVLRKLPAGHVSHGQVLHLYVSHLRALLAARIKGRRR